MLDTAFVRSVSYLMQRKVLSARSRKAVAGVIARVRPKMPVKESPLSTTGFLELGQALSSAEISEIKALLGPGPLFEPYKRDLSEFVLGAIPEGAHLGQYRRSHVVRVPHLLKLANRPDVLSHAAAVIGGKPTLSDMLVWWSFPGQQEPTDAQLWHRDRADWKMVKLFVYLTDVDEESGPHIYAKNSALGGHLVDLRRFKEAEVREHYKDVVVATGFAGHAIMTNPQGLHRGSLPTKLPRLVFEATYSLMGLPNANYLPHGIEPAILPNISFDPWINRYFARVSTTR